MIATILRKEFAELLRDGRFRGAGVFVGLLLLGSVVTGWKFYHDAQTERAEAQALTREHWLAQEAKNPHAAAHYGIYAFKQLLPLALADRGVDSFLGTFVWLEAHKQNQFQYRPAKDASAAARFGELTAAGTMQVLIPLVIILLCFSSFAGEREQGTLRQLLSLGVPRQTLLVGKMLGMASALACILVPAAVIGSAAILFASAGQSSTVNVAGGFDVVRLLWMVLAYLLYFAAVLGGVFAVSAWAKSSRAVLVALLGVWVLWCFVAPKFASDFSKRLYPTPTMQAFAAAVKHDIEQGLDGHDPQDKRRERIVQQLLEKYHLTDEKKLPLNIDGMMLEEGEKSGNAAFDKHFPALWNQYERQNSVQTLLALGAPFLAMREASMGLAGTDFEHHRDFAVHAERYRRSLITQINEFMTTKTRKDGSEVKADAALWKAIPEFRYTTPTGVWAALNERWNLAVLALWCVSAWLVALWRVERLSVL
jgi:ABC-2 type transport system permease protein